MPKIECFDKITHPDVAKALKDKFDSLVTDDMPESEQKSIGRKIALDYHEELHGDLNKLKGSMGLNAAKYKPEDNSSKEKTIRDKYDDEIRETKASIPEPPDNEPAPTEEGNDGTRISKAGVFEQYGREFEKTPIGWNDITKSAVADLAERAKNTGTTVEAQAKNEVDAMLHDLQEGKLKVDEKSIAVAVLHLMNQDEHIDNLSNQKPDTELSRGALAVEMLSAQNERDHTLRLIDAMGTKFGRGLGMYAGIFSKEADGGIKATRRILEGITNVSFPQTEAELDANTEMSRSDKEKIRPYVQKLEAIKAEYDAKAKETKAETKERKKTTDKIRSLADKVRNSKTLEDWGLGKPIDGKVQGFTLNIKETVADALEFIADGIDKGIEIAQLIKDATDKYRGENSEKDFTGLLNHLMDQNKPLEDTKSIPIDVAQDAKDAAMEFQRRATLGQLNALVQQATDANKKWYMKALDWRRSFIIGGLKTLGRVGLSGISKVTVDPLIRLTTGNIASILPGLGDRAVAPKRTAEGFGGLVKFKDNAAAVAFADQKQNEFLEASKALEKNLGDRSLQEKYMNAEMENAKADIYRYINGNIWTDAKELARTGSTEFEQAMGGYSKIDPTVLRGSDKALYYLSSLARLHGVEKNPSARRALIEGYNNKLAEYQRNGVPLSASTRMRALDMAYGDFMGGKYQNKTQLSDYVNERKYEGNRPNASTVKKALSTFYQLALPVAKVPINIVKTGVDMSTLGIEGFIKYLGATRKNMKLNEADGKEYDNIWQKFGEAAKDIPEKDKAYIHNVMSKGLFGLGLMAYAAWGVKNGTIRYGGSYEDRQDKRKYKGKDGEWHDDLDYGQWVINGHKFGKFGSSVLNHLPEFLPIAMVVNTHNVYQYEHTYPGEGGNKTTKTKEGAFWEAMKSDIHEVSEKLPFNNLLEPGQLFAGLATIPITKDIGQYFDKDSEGHQIARKPNGLLQHLAYGVGWNSIVDKKKPKE